jgi:hypothetical protein
MGQTATWRQVRATSAVPSEPDIRRRRPCHRRCMYGRCPRCKRNLTYRRSVRVQPCAAKRTYSIRSSTKWSAVVKKAGATEQCANVVATNSCSPAPALTPALYRAVRATHRSADRGDTRSHREGHADEQQIVAHRRDHRFLHQKSLQCFEDH